MRRDIGRIVVGIIVLIASSRISDTAEEHSRRNGTGRYIDADKEISPSEAARLATSARLYLVADLIGLGGIVLAGMGAGPYLLRLFGWLLISDSIRAGFLDSHLRVNTPELAEEGPCDTAAQL